MTDNSNVGGRRFASAKEAQQAMMDELARLGISLLDLLNDPGLGSPLIREACDFINEQGFADEKDRDELVDNLLYVCKRKPDARLADMIRRGVARNGSVITRADISNVIAARGVARYGRSAATNLCRVLGLA